MLYCRFQKCVLLNFVSNVRQRRRYLNAYVLEPSVGRNLIKMTFRIFVLTALTISCSYKSDKVDDLDNQQIANPLNRFDWRKGAEFTQIKDNNAIALQLTRADSLTLRYRIELNRQWKGSTFDTGTIVFQKTLADTGILLTEQSSECRLTVFISNDSLQHNLYAQIERLCSDTTENILNDDFPMIRLKGGF